MSISPSASVLVIEDDADVREAISELARGEGVQVIEVEDGARALDYLQTTDELPCLILLDLRLPGLNGWEFRAAQEHDRRLSKIPVVVMTGADDPPPGVHVMHKPLTLIQLLGVLAVYCKKPMS